MVFSCSHGSFTIFILTLYPLYRTQVMLIFVLIGVEYFRESGLVGSGVVVRIGRFLVQTPLGARPGIGTQPRYEAPGDLRVENVKRSD